MREMGRRQFLMLPVSLLGKGGKDERQDERLEVLEHNQQWLKTAVVHDIILLDSRLKAIEVTLYETPTGDKEHKG